MLKAKDVKYFLRFSTSKSFELWGLVMRNSCNGHLTFQILNSIIIVRVAMRKRQKHSEHYETGDQ